MSLHEIPTNAQFRPDGHEHPVFREGPDHSMVVGHFAFCYKRWWDLHSALLALTLGYAFSGTLSQVVRISAGRPRPDFIARCNPSPDIVNAPVFGLANVTICQETDFVFLQDGMRSFFSGHAILAAFGFGFTSLYYAGKLHLFDGKSHSVKLLLTLRAFADLKWKVWLVIAPIIVAIWVCLTRVADRRHHWQDVTTGFFLGILIAFTVYRQFFPHIADPESHLCFPPRFEEDDKRKARTPQDNREWLPLSGIETTPFRPQSELAEHRQNHDSVV
ncbi:PAP2-domain-containing protein [Dendrothele bispora CBS 962.96]|uniref:PAP2-domain-containing protein n=1 Tax=Dendrothele bispora (strain CBS 962.96) TaxID=1314807 RepID=A0A4S8LWH9_DENBC|nr:PAP2-domain-containing protein [Dendrothele bispora CBS 962.96]